MTEFETLVIAELRALKAEVIAMRAPVPVANSVYTFHAWLDEWCKTYKAPSVSEKYLYTIDVAIRVHIKAVLPDLPLNMIGGIALQKFLTSIDKSRTRKVVYDVLKSSFHEAVILKLISDNPMLSVKIPPHKRKVGNALTVAEEKKFLKDIKGHNLEVFFKFLLYSGCRRGEALNLFDVDVDFKKKQIHICGTKTKTSDRTIPLFKNLGALLVDFRPLYTGKYFNFRGDYPTHVFKKFCPNHKLHDLRHTFATRCLEAKIPLKVVQIWLGHSEIDTTADIYSHVTQELHNSEAKVLDEYLSKKAL